MCGRFFVAPDNYTEQLRGILAGMRGAGAVLAAEARDVFPSELVPVVANNRQLMHCVFPMKWGIPDSTGKGLIINARSETVAVKPLFCESARCRRCLIPASGYYEWERRDGRQTKYAITLDGDAPSFLAGIYLTAGGRSARFVILTRDAAPNIAFIHDRMPVFIPPDSMDDWLSPDVDIERMLVHPLTAVSYMAV